MKLVTALSFEMDDRLLGLVQTSDGCVVLALDLEIPAPPDSSQYADWVSGVVELVRFAGFITGEHVPSIADVISAGIDTVPLYASADLNVFSGDYVRRHPDLTKLDCLDSFDETNVDAWVVVRTLQFWLPGVSGWYHPDRSTIAATAVPVADC